MPVKTAVKALVTILLFGVLLRSVDISQLKIDVHDITYAPLLLAFAMLILQLVIFRALRWNVILARLDHPLRFSKACVLNTISQFFNQVLPSTVGGDGVRIFMLHQEQRPLRVAVHSVLIDRLMGMTALLVLCVMTLPFSLGYLTETKTVTVLLALSALLTLVSLFLPTLLHLSRMKAPPRLGEQLRAFEASIKRLWTQGRAFVTLLALSVLGHLLLSTSMWLIGFGFGLHIALLPTLLLLPAVFLMTTIPISLGGWGIREGAMILLLGLIGVAPAQALMMSVLYGLSELAICSFGGIIWLLQRQGAPLSGAPSLLQSQH